MVKHSLGENKSITIHFRNVGVEYREIFLDFEEEKADDTIRMKLSFLVKSSQSIHEYFEEDDGKHQLTLYLWMKVCKIPLNIDSMIDYIVYAEENHTEYSSIPISQEKPKDEDELDQMDTIESYIETIMKYLQDEQNPVPADIRFMAKYVCDYYDYNK